MEPPAFGAAMAGQEQHPARRTRPVRDLPAADRSARCPDRSSCTRWQWKRLGVLHIHGGCAKHQSRSLLRWAAPSGWYQHHGSFIQSPHRRHIPSNGQFDFSVSHHFYQYHPRHRWLLRRGNNQLIQYLRIKRYRAGDDRRVRARAKMRRLRIPGSGRWATCSRSSADQATSSTTCASLPS